MRFELNDIAPRFAQTALNNIVQEYPHHLNQALAHAQEMATPRALHPVFYGSYDWHSSVHMHWLLARLLNVLPLLPQTGDIVRIFDAHFTPAKVASEIAFMQQPANRTFERTYGWAWLLKLQTELNLLARKNNHAATWRDALQALADLIVQRYLEFLPLAQFPIRAGTHANSAFGLLFALEYAQCIGHAALCNVIISKAHAWFGHDRSYPAAYEPGGDDFLSSGLMEAALMTRILNVAEFSKWWQEFIPPQSGLPIWLTPVAITDHTDPKLIHLAGLNLSRAWCWKMLAPLLPEALQPAADTAAEAHLAVSLPHSLSANYASAHWLASFAVLAMATNDDGL